MSKNTTKRSLLASVMALALCVIMLVGTTFAWFTDTASTSVNKIQAGKLDVALEMAVGTNEDGSTKWVSAEGETLQFKKADGHENETVLWEPGCTYELPALRVVNNGNLALKYKIEITGIKGDAKLNEVIDWTINDAAINLTEGHLDALEEGAAFTIKGQMQTTAGNEYQGLTVDGIGITVYATQDTVEYDSINNLYDTRATYLNTDAEGYALISNADELVYFAKMVNVDGERTQKAKLVKDIDLLGKKWAPIGSAANPFSGTFDGNGHTISNLTVYSAEAAGLFGRMYGTVKDLTVTNATVTGNHWAGVIAGYSTANGMTISGCTVTNSTVSIAPEKMANGAYDNGDKAGGIIGYCVYGDTVTGCTVKNTTIKGYRDIGGILGCGIGNVDGNTTDVKVNVTNNTIENVTVIQDNTNGYASAPITTVDSFVGRKDDLTDTEGCTGTATIQVIQVAASQEELTAAINNATGPVAVKLGEGSYTLNGLSNKTVTIAGTKDTVIDLENSPMVKDNPQNNNLDITFDGVTVKFNKGDDYKGIRHSKKVTYKNCILTGKQFMYATDVEFIGCKFENKSDYAVWTYGATNVLFEDCEFTNSNNGKAILIYREGGGTTNVTVNYCKFEADRPLIKAAIETGDNPAKTYNINVVINDSTATGTQYDYKLWGNKNDMPAERLSVTVDGARVH